MTLKLPAFIKRLLEYRYWRRRKRLPRLTRKEAWHRARNTF